MNHHLVMWLSSFEQWCWFWIVNGSVQKLEVGFSMPGWSVDKCYKNKRAPCGHNAVLTVNIGDSGINVVGLKT